MTTAVTPAQVRVIAPELSCLSDELLDTYIELATCLISESVFDDADCGEKATMFFAAHLATLGKRGGVSGAVTQEKVGDISRSYSNGSALDDQKELGLTSYGQIVMMLRRTLIVTPNCV